MLVGVIFLVSAIATARQARAEPMALEPTDTEQRISGVATEPSALVGGLPNGLAGELRVSGAALGTAATSGTDSTDRSSTAPATKPVADATAVALEPPVPSPPTRNAAQQPASRLAPTRADTVDEEPEWEREIREAVRPIYHELAASGVVDAVQGFKSYLAMLGVIVSGETATSTGQRAKTEGSAESRDGIAETTWETRAGNTDAQAPGRSYVHGERERVVAAMIFDEWIAAARPWLYTIAALLIVWQIVRFAFVFLRSRSMRAQRRSAKSSRRSAANARARARS